MVLLLLRVNVCLIFFGRTAERLETLVSRIISPSLVTGGRVTRKGGVNLLYFVFALRKNGVNAGKFGF